MEYSEKANLSDEQSDASNSILDEIYESNPGASGQKVAVQDQVQKAQTPKEEEQRAWQNRLTSLKKEPNNFSEPEIATLHEKLARSYKDNSPGMALYHYNETIKYRENADPALSIEAYKYVASQYIKSQDYANVKTNPEKAEIATQHLKKALMAQQKSFPNNHAEEIEILELAGKAFQCIGNNRSDGQAAACLESALRIRETQKLPKNDEYAQTCLNLGDIYCNLDGKTSARAANLYKQALNSQEKLYGPNDAHLIPALDRFSKFSNSTEKRLNLERALDISKTLPDTKNETLAKRHDELAVLYVHTGEQNKAKAYQDQALAMWTVPPKNGSSENYADKLRETGQHDLVAIKEYEKALSNAKESHLTPASARLHEKLGYAYLSIGDQTKAESNFQNALQARQEYNHNQHLYLYNFQDNINRPAAGKKFPYEKFTEERKIALKGLADVYLSRLKGEPNRDASLAYQHLKEVTEIENIQCQRDAKPKDLKMAELNEQLAQVARLHAIQISNTHSPSETDKINLFANSALKEAIEIREINGQGKGLQVVENLINLANYLDFQLLSSKDKDIPQEKERDSYYQKAFSIQSGWWDADDARLLPLLDKVINSYPENIQEQIKLKTQALLIEQKAKAPIEKIFYRMSELGLSQRNASRYEDANATFITRLDLARAHNMKEHIESSLLALSKIAAKQNKIDAAINYQKEAIKIIPAREISDYHAYQLEILGDLHNKAKNWEDAAKTFTAVLEMKAILQPPQIPGQLRAEPEELMEKLAEIYGDKNKFLDLDKAIETNKQLLAAQEKLGKHSTSSQSQAQRHLTLAKLLREKGLDDEALDHELKSQAAPVPPKTKTLQDLQEEMKDKQKKAREKEIKPQPK